MPYRNRGIWGFRGNQVGMWFSQANQDALSSNKFLLEPNFSPFAFLAKGKFKVSSLVNWQKVVPFGHTLTHEPVVWPQVSIQDKVYIPPLQFGAGPLADRGKAPERFYIDITKSGFTFVNVKAMSYDLQYMILKNRVRN